MRILLALLALCLSASVSYADCLYLRGTNQVVSSEECFSTTFDDTCDSAYSNAIRA